MDKKTSLINSSLKVIKTESARIYDNAAVLSFELDRNSKLSAYHIEQLRASVDKIEFHLSSLEKL